MQIIGLEPINFASCAEALIQEKPVEIGFFFSFFFSFFFFNFVFLYFSNFNIIFFFFFFFFVTEARGATIADGLAVKKIGGNCYPIIRELVDR